MFENRQTQSPHSFHMKHIRAVTQTGRVQQSNQAVRGTTYDYDFNSIAGGPIRADRRAAAVRTVRDGSLPAAAGRRVGLARAEGGRRPLKRALAATTAAAVDSWTSPSGRGGKVGLVHQSGADVQVKRGRRERSGRSTTEIVD